MLKQQSASQEIFADIVHEYAGYIHAYQLSDETLFKLMHIAELRAIRIALTCADKRLGNIGDALLGEASEG